LAGQCTTPSVPRKAVLVWAFGRKPPEIRVGVGARRRRIGSTKLSFAIEGATSHALLELQPRNSTGGKSLLIL